MTIDPALRSRLESFLVRSIRILMAFRGLRRSNGWRPSRGACTRAMIAPSSCCCCFKDWGDGWKKSAIFRARC